MPKINELTSEGRRVISTKLYRPEFVNFKKICDSEKKSVHAKLREMIKQEIEKDPKMLSKTLLLKKKEDIEKTEGILNVEKEPRNFKIRARKIKNVKWIKIERISWISYRRL